jgi:uncharacterized membrane protein
LSDGRLRAIVAVLALAGLAIAVYLTVTWYADAVPACVGGADTGCERVQTSDYADLAGVPVALLGAVGYGLILASLAVPGDAGRMSGLLLALVGFGFTAYLTYLELFVLAAICQWCVASAVVMTALLIAVGARFLRA